MSDGERDAASSGKPSARSRILWRISSLRSDRAAAESATGSRVAALPVHIEAFTSFTPRSPRPSIRQAPTFHRLCGPWWTKGRDTVREPGRGKHRTE